MSTAETSHGSSRQDVTSVVARALAEKENVSPASLSPPLYDVIDPEALEDLFRNTSGRLVFEYGEYEVTVDDEYTVDVRTVR